MEGPEGLILWAGRLGPKGSEPEPVGQTHATYNTRQAAYDLRKLRGKQLVGKPPRTRRYYLPGPAARTISALLTLRDHVIAPILAGVQIRRTTTSPPG